MKQDNLTNVKDILARTESISHLEPWIFHLVAICVFTILARILVIYFLRYSGKAANLTSGIFDKALLRASEAPAMILIWFIAIKMCVEVLAERFYGEQVSFLQFPLLKVGIIITIAWFLLRFVNYYVDAFVESGKIKKSRLDHTTADAISKLVRLTIVIISTLVMAQTVGFSVSGILAAGGAGGLVLGFAAKDLLANLFGGLTIYLDRPFSVGDWVRCVEKDIEGTVEYIGWRHTRIRAFNMNPIYVPNAIFTTLVVENPSRMTHRRIDTVIGIRYCDISKMKSITAEVKQMLDNHDDIDNERVRLVNFEYFNNSSLDFKLYAFSKTVDWYDFTQIKQDVLLKVSDIIKANNAEIAFPTRTLYIEKNGEDL